VKTFVRTKPAGIATTPINDTAPISPQHLTPVAEWIGIGPETRFTGKIDKITLEVGAVKQVKPMSLASPTTMIPSRPSSKDVEPA
jgi:hypothetical protein